MAIIKCKMCGGDIELTTEKTYGTCEYCGSTMTLPKIDDEQRAAAFNRGNHFRRIGEFDKALAVYERIVREDDTDAEAHWCCALCRFGIEYVEDPASYEYLPTCHRASFDSFLEDVDYLAAVEHSQGITKRQYQKDGAKIAEVQRGILATSQNTEPYDVFICYKESDESGGRTRDSLMAQDIYYQLTEQGRKVFFARITLEDVAGAQYEPYIFAALNSAKVMIVVGTKPEHLNAVWVKNEWSRFLAMMKKDRHKLLLPCYRDMDPYDMPEQLSVLQSYDMAKIGFIQDLTRGIAKVLDAEKKPETVKETVVVQQTAAPANNTASLLKRAFMFLEDGDWNAANEYCEKVLDIDPESARAYLGKLMAELKVKKQEELKNCAEPFDHLNSYQKTLRFADKSIVEELKADIDFINERNEQQRLEGLYLDAMRKMDEAKIEAAYKSAAIAFAQISGYRDADERQQLCLDKAKECGMKVIYDNAVREAKKDTVYALKEAIRKLERIRNWFDASQKITDFERRIKEIEAKEEAERQEAARKSARNKKIGLIVGALVAVGIIFWALMVNVIIPNSKYNDAVDLMEAGKYGEAISAFEALEGHKDSANQIVECKYLSAASLMEEEKYEEAIAAFGEIDGYKDSETKINECNTAILDGKYNDAMALMEAEKYAEAKAVFRNLSGYKDSDFKIEECDTAIMEGKYNDALALMEAEKYEDAIAAFRHLAGYRDSSTKINECNTAILDGKYNDAIAFLDAGKLDEAYNIFTELGDYKDACDKVEELGITLMRVGSYITFGLYEQDDNTANGKEEIEWLILERDGDRALLISKYALSRCEYDTNYWDGSTWEKCTLRQWLNNDFFIDAFDDNEKKMILPITVIADSNQGPDSEKKVTDRLFVLSTTEVEVYRQWIELLAPVCYTNNTYAACWLRTTGHSYEYACYMNSDTSVNTYGARKYNQMGVIPAMWIDLSMMDDAEE